MIQELRLQEFHRRLERSKDAERQILKKTTKKVKLLHVVYAMTNVSISGGVKVILEHANGLQRAGVKVTLVSHFMKPSWFPVEANYKQIPFGLELAKGIPECDVIVATYWDHIQACIETGIAPVVYFEQGDFNLFDYDSMNESLKEFIQKQYEIVPFVCTVSHNAAKFVQQIYGRNARVFPNAVDKNIFSQAGDKEFSDRPYILMVGSESSAFKGIPNIISAYEKVKSSLDIDLFWITPASPSNTLRNKVTKVFINPSQQKISNLYRGASLYVCGSTYESFSLPTLEAMSCGCPVVTTSNIGVMEYAVDGRNALICKINNPEDMAAKISAVLVDEELKSTMITNGLETADGFNWELIIDELIQYYRNIAAKKIKPKNKLKDWELIVAKNRFSTEEDYVRLKKFLLVTKADIIKVPVMYNIGKSPVIARWETAACRKSGREALIDYCFCPTQAFNKLQMYNLPGYSSFLYQNYEKALEEFSYVYEHQGNPKEKAVAARWILLTLLRLQRKQLAKKRLREFLATYPDNADFYMLGTLINDDPKHGELVQQLGDAASYPEFFLEVQSQFCL